MLAKDITPKMKVTVLYKGAPFANTYVTRIFERFGTTKVFLFGNEDEHGNPHVVGLDEIRPVTNGFYHSNPNKSNGKVS